LRSDEEAEEFLAGDLTDYIAAENFAPYRFELRPKPKSINLRVSEELLEAVRDSAAKEGIPYQRYIRRALEQAVSGKAASRGPAKPVAKASGAASGRRRKPQGR
jgi:predicted DNA binding CopG/RHH family protein